MSDGIMIAIAVEGGTGPASALRPVQTPRPVPGEREILIRVKAAGVNRPDIVQRQGAYPPPPGASSTLGLEVSGVVEVASGRWSKGDRVCALLGGGGYAGYAVCDALHALPIPPGLDFIQAAGLPETIFTVWANVFEYGNLKAGELLMVHGATSGIGVAAIQMAKAAGARVLATARGAQKADQALRIGADIAVDTTTESFAQVAKREGGVDVVLEMVGGDYFAADLEALKAGGRIVFIAAQAGSDVALPVFRLMQKRATVTGSMLRPLSADEKARLAHAVEENVWPWIATGAVKPVVDRTFPLEQAAEAHAYLEAGSHVGKVILVVEKGET